MLDPLTEFLDAITFGEKLCDDLANCSHFHIAVSYVRTSGIKPLLKLAPRQLEHSQVITCTDFGITEPEALLALLRHGYRIRAFRKPGLHAKVWIIYFDDQPPVLYLGSSNLSLSATSTNVEANVRILDSKTIEQAIKWFSSLATSQLTVDVDKQWIESYNALRSDLKPQEQVVPKQKTTEYAFTTPEGTWHQRQGGKTFLAQGIIEGVTDASPSRDQLLSRIRVDKRARLVLLAHRDTGELYVAADIEATLNPTGPSTVQLGGGRKQVHKWIKSVWGFPSNTSAQKNQQRVWQEWFGSTNWRLSDFKYEILVDLKDLVPTIWVKARRPNI